MKSTTYRHSLEASSRQRMAPEPDMEKVSQQPSGQPSNFPNDQRSWNSISPAIGNSQSSNKSEPIVYPSPLPSNRATTPIPVNTAQNSNFKAPDSKVTPKKQNHILGAPIEATKRTSIAEHKAGEYPRAKQNLERQLKDLDAQAKRTLAAYNHLTAQNETLKESLAKLQEHAKNCEKATAKAQEDARTAQGHADQMINNLKNQLLCAEKERNNAARELKVWKERYGDVEDPAEQIAALRMILLKWRSKGGKGQGEIAGLEGGRRSEERRTRVKLEDEGPSSRIGPEKENRVSVKTEKISNSGTSEAEAKATKYKAERDALHRVLTEEMAKNSKMAEALVLRNAKIAGSLEGEMGR